MPTKLHKAISLILSVWVLLFVFLSASHIDHTHDLLPVEQSMCDEDCNKPEHRSENESCDWFIAQRVISNDEFQLNILFICGGAFAGIDKIISTRGDKSSIGFEAEVKDKSSRNIGAILKNIETEDLLKFGLIPEFVGRLPVVATLEDLNKDALIEILTKPKNALVKQYQKLFGFENVKLQFTEDALNSVASKALEKNTGARGLRTILENILLDTMFTLPGIEGVDEIVVNADVVEKSKDPLYIYNKSNKVYNKKA